MRIIHDRPPLFEQIDAAFQVAGKPLVFCWGEVIFNPEGIRISPELIKHEEVHSERQGRSEEQIAAWWRRYIENPDFRYSEELLAHRAEYRAFCRRHGSWGKRTRYLDRAAARLASPLYGSSVSPMTARHAILTFRSAGPV